jgi:ribonuclease HI
MDVLEVLGHRSNTFHSTHEDFHKGNGSRIDLVLANPTALALIVDAKVMPLRLVGGHSPIIIEIDCKKTDLAGFRLEPCKAFCVPKVVDQEPERRSFALKEVVKAAPSYLSLLNKEDLTPAWTRLNNIMDTYLKTMADQNIGDYKSRGFAFSLKKLLPPTTITRGVVSAAETHLVHVHNTITLLQDLKSKVKREVHNMSNDMQWKKIAKRIASTSLPASVQLIAQDHEVCPPFWVLDTALGSLQLYVRAVDRANAAHRTQEAKARFQGHAFWKKFRPPRPRPPRVVSLSDGSIVSDPQCIIEEVTHFWQGIYNDAHIFNRDKYWHRYRHQLRQLQHSSLHIDAISAEEFMKFARNMGNNSAGLDGRSATELKALPLDIWELVAAFWENVRCFPNKALPLQLVQAGVHLIPKPGEVSGTPLVSNLRPITVLPLLFRVWSGIMYKRLREWMSASLPRGITGGKAHGEVAAIALQLSLSMEESKAGLNKLDTYVLTTDFSKFFDALNWEFVFALAEHMGLPTWLCQFYQNYLGCLQRHFIFGGFFNPTPCLAKCGAPQGDALSLVWAAVGLAVWALLMERNPLSLNDRVSSTAMAYVDDRYILAYDHKNIYRLLKETIEHDKLAGFKLNLGKSAITASSPQARRRLTRMNLSIPLKLCFKALGHCISSINRRSYKLVHTRFGKARSSLRRVVKASIVTKLQKGRAISGLCLPQATYGTWLSGVPVRAGRSLGSSFLKMLWGKGGHYRAKEMALTLLYPVHLVCPLISSDYTLLTTVARISRRHGYIGQQLSRLIDFFEKQKITGISGNFPASRLLETVANLGCNIDSHLNITSPLCPTVNLCSVAGSFLGHYLRDLFRMRLWHELRDRSLRGERSDFSHLQIIDVKASTKWHRSMKPEGASDFIIRRTLELVLTGAVASTSRLFRHQEPCHTGAAPPSTSICPCCGQEDEDVSHIYWRCGAFSNLRENFLKEWKARWHKQFCTESMLASHGLAAEDVSLLLWRRDTYHKDWDYGSHSLPTWLGDGDADFEDGRLVVFTDGSCKGQADSRVRSAGCGIFVCPGHPWNTSFALPGVVLSSEMAELRALLHAAEGATAQQVDIEIKLDNQFVADTASAVLNGSTCWPANGHHWWKRLSIAQQAQLSAGCAGHKATWIKGHASPEDVALGIITDSERFGNSEADKLACKAASTFSCPRDLVLGVSQREEQAEQVQRYLVEVLLSRHLLLLPLKVLSESPGSDQRDASEVRTTDLTEVQAIREAFFALHPC